MKNKKDDKPHYLPMLVGLALGVGIGSALDGQNRNRESDESQKDNEE